ncbi:MAG TPA: hypothetical protein DEA84_10350 [Erwinia persicina]|nr:hypothetical protein [Erwinia persicina]
MQTLSIAICLSAIYALSAPDGQPVWVHLCAGLLCLVTAMAITGSELFSNVQVGEKILSVMPYALMITGIVLTARGVALYARGPETGTLGGADVVSALDETLPLVFCLSGVVLFLASGAHLYLRRRQQG